jgi:hypothetical protein
VRATAVDRAFNLSYRRQRLNADLEFAVPEGLAPCERCWLDGLASGLLTSATPIGVMRCRTLLPVRTELTRPAALSTLACSLALDWDMPTVRASAEVVRSLSKRTVGVEGRTFAAFGSG